MTGKRLIASVCGMLVLAWASAAFGGLAWINGLAPDWNHPYDYPDPFDNTGPGPDPNPGQCINPWDAWCTPTAAACMMGHWADVKGDPNTGDGSADGNQAIVGGYGGNNWATASDWHDYTADGFNRPGPGNYPHAQPPTTTDLGWYMNTNNLGAQNLTFQPVGGHTGCGTYVGNCAEGLNNFLTNRGSALAGDAKETYVAGNLPPVIAAIKNEIDNNRTVLGHFKWWVNPNSGAAGNGDGSEGSEGEFDFDYYDFATGFDPDDEEFNYEDGEGGLGHTVCIVGYQTNAQGAVIGLFAHDNWVLTGRNVGVPVNAQMPLNAITTVPEPATLSLLAIGGLAALARRRRR